MDDGYYDNGPARSMKGFFSTKGSFVFPFMFFMGVLMSVLGLCILSGALLLSGTMLAIFGALMSLLVWNDWGAAGFPEGKPINEEKVDPILSSPLTQEEIVAIEEVRKRKKDARGGLSIAEAPQRGSLALADELTGALSLSGKTGVSP